MKQKKWSLLLEYLSFQIELKKLFRSQKKKMKIKKLWVWIEDSHLRKAIITDNLIIIYNENDEVIMKIINPSESLKKQIISRITKNENVLGDNSGRPNEII